MLTCFSVPSKKRDYCKGTRLNEKSKCCNKWERNYVDDTIQCNRKFKKKKFIKSITWCDSYIPIIIIVLLVLTFDYFKL